jgi:hypothetical protein
MTVKYAIKENLKFGANAGVVIPVKILANFNKVNG